MAMNKVLLGKSIADLITSADAPADSKAQIEKLWTDIAGAIIDHITQNAQVNVNVTTTVAPGILVTTAGSAVAQTGATTSTGTGTGSGTGTIS